MGFAIGIDTGGTFTDGAIIDLDTMRVVQKAKSLTTREELAVGIRGCLEQLQLPDPSAIHHVALSTTLATNAVVEGKGCEAGAVLIGREPLGALPAKQWVVVPGGHSLSGKAVEDLDTELLRRELGKLAGKVDAVAISGYLSVRNPEHEVLARDIAREVLGVPVVCAHQLTTALGFQERTVSAILNAKIIPLISQLLESVEQVLKQKGISAPLMIVRSNGSLVSAQVVKGKPIETILSGPAASITGAAQLSGENHALVLDMGGTTTDIAVFRNSRPRVNPEGAYVGGWQTRIKAVDAYTFGLGGDSHIAVNPVTRRFTVGPRRVIPISYAAFQYPYLLRELESCSLDSRVSLTQPTDAFTLLGEVNEAALPDEQLQVARLLKDGPHTLYSLARRLRIEPEFVPVKELENTGKVNRISLTPTDILHITGECGFWNTEAAKLLAELLAEQMWLGKAEFVEVVEREITAKIIAALLQSMLYMEGDKANLEREKANPFVRKILARNKETYFTAIPRLKLPVVAIGAPVGAWLPRAFKKMEGKLVIPPCAEVANAVGAAAGKVIEQIEALVKPNQAEGGFTVHLPWDVKIFIEKEDAEDFAVREATDRALADAVKAGAEQPQVSVNKEETYVKAYGTDMYVHTMITVTAEGRPVR